MAAELRDVPVLKNANEPGHKRTLAVEARQDGETAGLLGGIEGAPELVDVAVLSLLVARIEPGGTSTQGVHQEAVATAGAGGEKVLPGGHIALQARRRHEPVERIQVVQIVLPANRSARFVAIKLEGAMQ